MNIKKQLENKKILFATTPADGHVNPLTDLACFLQSCGCDVRWYTAEIFRNKIEKLGIPFYPFIAAPIANGSNVVELFPERSLIIDAGAKANFDMTHFFAKMAPGAFKDIQDIMQTFSFDIVIADSTFTALPIIKKQLNKPVIAIGVVPLAEESVDLGPYGPGFCPPPNKQQEEEFAGLKEVFNNVVFKESIDAYSAILNEYGIVHEKALIFDTLVKQADLYLQIGTPSFEYERSDLSENIRFIGSLLPHTPRDGHKPWFDERVNTFRNVVLVTQGTVEGDTTKIIEPTLEAFKDSDTFVIATTGGNRTDYLKAKYPYANLIIEDYIPFSEVMPHANVYITNGGYSGTLLSIKNRLPIVAAGIHEGKAEVCSRIGFFKYGVNLNTETPSAEMIRKGVLEVIANRSYKSNISTLASEMEDYNANELCAGYIIELLYKKNVEANTVVKILPQ
jgi:MGT family glycosyltransferase